MVKFGKDKFNSSNSSLQGVGKLLSHFQTTVSGCTIPDVSGIPNINYNDLMNGKKGKQNLIDTLESLKKTSIKTNEECFRYVK